MRLNLGDEVRDVVTGYQGIIVTRSEHTAPQAHKGD